MTSFKRFVRKCRVKAHKIVSSGTKWTYLGILLWSPVGNSSSDKITTLTYLQLAYLDCILIPTYIERGGRRNEPNFIAWLNKTVSMRRGNQ